MAKFLKDKNTYANRFPVSMKKGGKKPLVKRKPGGPISSEGPVKKPSMLQEDRGNEGWNAYIEKLKTTGVPGTKEYEMLKNQKKTLTLQKKGGSINKTAGKTTTGVVSNYKGYKGPKVKAQVAKVKKAKGKL